MSEEIQSLYEKIKQARQADGSLPEEFSLRPMAENGMRFADGAMLLLAITSNIYAEHFCFIVYRDMTSRVRSISLQLKNIMR